MSITNAIQVLNELEIHPDPAGGLLPEEAPDGWRVFYVHPRGIPVWVNAHAGLAFVALDEQAAPMHRYAPAAPLSAWLMRAMPDDVEVRRHGSAVDDHPEELAIPVGCMVWLARRLWPRGVA